MIAQSDSAPTLVPELELVSISLAAANQTGLVKIAPLDVAPRTAPAMECVPIRLASANSDILARIVLLPSARTHALAVANALSSHANAM